MSKKLFNDLNTFCFFNNYCYPDNRDNQEYIKMNFDVLIVNYNKSKNCTDIFTTIPVIYISVEH